MIAINMTALPLTSNGTYYVKEGVVHEGEYYFFKIANNDFENCLICDVGQQLDVKISFAVVNSTESFFAKYANTFLEKTVAQLDNIDTCYVTRTVG